MVENGKYLEHYELNIESTSGIISIASETESIFAMFQEEYSTKHPNSKKKVYNTDCIYAFNYVIYIPENSKAHISSYTGSITSQYFYGDLTTNLAIGNITIDKYKGKLNLTTNGGDINIKATDANFIAETINGNIYADEKIMFSKIDSIMIGQRIESNFKNAINKLRLKTFNGNIFLKQ